MFYYAQGTALAARSELVAKRNEISKFYADIAKGSRPINVPFSTGVLTADNVLKECDINTQSELIPWEPIGLGKPLTIEIREVYTGKFRSLLNNKKDMLVTSAIKSSTTFNAQISAVNFIKSKVSQYRHYKVPDAIEVGTRFIFYSPALTEKDKSLSLNLRIIFDDFPNSVFETLSVALATAGAIPIFAEKRGLLLAASWLTEIMGNVGQTLFDGQPDFDASEALDIYVAGTVPLKPGYILFTDGNVDQIDSNFRSNYHVNKCGKVVHDEFGTEYDGDIPYLVISIDGTRNDILKEFTPTVASAAILSRFLGSQDKQNNSKDLVDALKLYNDFRLRKEFDELTQTLKNISEKYEGQIQELPDEPAKEELKKKRDAELKELKEKQKALVANILEERLKPKMQNP